MDSSKQSLIAVVKHCRSPEAVVLVIQGSLDQETSPAFYEQAATFLREAAGRKQGLILDLSGVGYISSSGIGALSRLLVDAESRLAHLYLATPAPRVLSVLSLLGLTEFFEILQTWSATE